MGDADIIVLGLGSMGSAAAATLAGRGRRVLGFERFTPAHTHGSGHGDSRVIRQSYFEDPSYVPLLLRAYELWEGLERATGAKLFTQTGGLFFGDPDSTVVAGSLRSARTWDLPHDELTATEIAARFPTARPRRDEIGMFETRAGFVRPEATIAAQLDLAARRGADLRFEEPALTWTATDGGVSVTTGRGTYTADRLVQEHPEEPDGPQLQREAQATAGTATRRHPSLIGVVEEEEALQLLTRRRTRELAVDHPARTPGPGHAAEATRQRGSTRLFAPMFLTGRSQPVSGPAAARLGQVACSAATSRTARRRCRARRGSRRRRR